MKTLLTDLQHSIAQAPEHRHCHMTCEMVYVKRGRARFSIAGVDYTACARFPSRMSAILRR